MGKMADEVLTELLKADPNNLTLKSKFITKIMAEEGSDSFWKGLIEFMRYQALVEMKVLRNSPIEQIEIERALADL